MTELQQKLFHRKQLNGEIVVEPKGIEIEPTREISTIINKEHEIREKANARQQVEMREDSSSSYSDIKTNQSNKNGIVTENKLEQILHLFTKHIASGEQEMVSIKSMFEVIQSDIKILKDQMSIIGIENRKIEKNTKTNLNTAVMESDVSDAKRTDSLESIYNDISLIKQEILNLNSLIQANMLSLNHEGGDCYISSYVNNPFQLKRQKSTIEYQEIFLEKEYPILVQSPSQNNDFKPTIQSDNTSLYPSDTPQSVESNNSNDRPPMSNSPGDTSGSMERTLKMLELDHHLKEAIQITSQNRSHRPKSIDRNDSHHSQQSSFEATTHIIIADNNSYVSNQLPVSDFVDHPSAEVINRKSISLWREYDIIKSKRGLAWWFGKRMPNFRPGRTNFEANWLSSSVYNRKKILQASYFDRFAEYRPSIVRDLKQRNLFDQSSLDGSVGLYLHYPKKRHFRIIRHTYDKLNKFERNKFEMELKSPSHHWAAVGLEKEENRIVGIEINANQNSNDLVMKTSFDELFFIRDTRLQELIEKVKKTLTITIFLSSPFDGCEREREIFMESVYPYLQGICKGKGVHLIAIDMRWGIWESQKTLYACLNGIDRSDIFIGYFGARYGTTINEWPQLREQINELSEKRYPYLSIQPSEKSVTDIEWQHSFLHGNFGSSSRKPIPFIFYRSVEKYDEIKAIEFELKHSSTANYKKNHYKIEDALHQSAANQLRAEVRKRAFATGNSKNKKCALFEDYADPDEGAQLMQLCCERVIIEVIKNLSEPDDVTSKRQQHAAFARSRLGIMIQKERCFKKCLKYIHVLSPNVKTSLPFVISGESGCGKSTIMASCALDPSNILDGSHMLFHFIGCTNASTYLSNLLFRLHSEISLLVKINIDDSFGTMGNGNNNISDYADLKAFEDLELNDVFNYLMEILIQYEDILPYPIVILIDALNQLVDDPYNEHYDLPSELKWLPSDFPPKVKVVISTLDGNALDELKKRNCEVNIVDMFSEEQRLQIVSEWLENYSKDVKIETLETLWKTPASSNPLYLTLALNYLIQYASYDTLKEEGLSGQFNALITSENVSQLLISIIRRMEESLYIRGVHRPDIIQFALQLIYCSNEGLSEKELIQIFNSQLSKSPTTSSFTQTSISNSDWFVIDYFLSQFISLRGEFYSFTHAYVRQAVRSLYFGISDDSQLLNENQKRIHQILVNYFRNEVKSLKIDEELEDYPRAMKELTFHQRKIGDRPSVLTAVRIRPLDNREKRLGETNGIVYKSGKQVMIVQPSTQQSTRYHNFDFCFDNANIGNFAVPNPALSQRRVFKLCGEEVILQALDGFNVSVIAYGQTGSGKTYTMFGVESSPGLIPLTVKDLLTRLFVREKQSGWVWSASCSMIEIYLDQINDLLSPSNDDKKESFAKIVEKQSSSAENDGNDDTERNFQKRSKRSMQIAGSVVPIRRSFRSYEDFEIIMSEGHQRRHVGTTNMNDASSRSHCVMTINLVQHNKSGGKLTSNINLVDLAGSERISKSLFDPKVEKLSINQHKDLRATEAIFVNKSLSALHRCMEALSVMADASDVDKSIIYYIPYRDSKLTTWLKDSLGGTAKVVYVYSNSYKMTVAKDKASAELQKQADKLLLAEIEAKSTLCDKFGFSESHVDLYNQYFKSVEVNSVSDYCAITSWTRELLVLNRRMRQLDDDSSTVGKSDEPIQWLRGWKVSQCTNASQARLVRSKPNEVVMFDVFVRLRSVNAYHVCVDREIATSFTINESVANNKESIVSDLTLTAPSKPGLYLVWLCDESHTSQRKDICYASYVAWLQVSQEVVPESPCTYMVWIGEERQILEEEPMEDPPIGNEIHFGGGEFNNSSHEDNGDKLENKSVTVENNFEDEDANAKPTSSNINRKESPIAVKDEEDYQTIVIDNGSGYIRCGFAGEDQPRVAEENIVLDKGRTVPKHYWQSVGFALPGMVKEKVFIWGSEVYGKHRTYPMKDFEMVNWDDMERIWHDIYYNRLRVYPEEGPTLATYYDHAPKANRERMTQIFFETFNSPSFYLGNRPSLSLYATGKTTGTVVTSCSSFTQTVPIYEGYPLPHAIIKTRIGGDNIDEYLMNLFQYSLTNYKNKEIVSHNFKRKSCFVSLNYGKDLQDYTSSECLTLPDGNSIELTTERFICMERLFRPDLITNSSKGEYFSSSDSVQDMAYQTIMKCDVDIRRELFGNVVLTGGNTLTKNFVERFSNELKALAPSTMQVNVIAPPESTRKNIAWIGGSIVASLSTFQQMFISKAEYDESGPSIVHRKCF
eukprot:gene5753-7943_t